MSTWQYKIGFSLKEFNEITGGEYSNKQIEEMLSKNGFEYKKVIVEEALREAIPSCLNAEYKNPSSMREDAPRAFSCSSLISYLYTHAGVWMPSLSIDKYVFGTPIQKEDLQFGDLVFSNTGVGMIRTETEEYQKGTKVPEGVDHVGMYFGNGEILHATKKYGKVLIDTFEDFEKLSKIIGFRRVANNKEERFVVKIPENMPNLTNQKSLISYIKNQ